MRKFKETNRTEFNTLNDIENYLMKRIQELTSLACDEKHKNPFIFADIACICDLVSYLPYSDQQMQKWRKNGNDCVSERYKQFLNDYVFIGNNGNYDLGSLFYHSVRCGIDHSFSVWSNKNKQIMILLSHGKNGFPEEAEIENKSGCKHPGIIFHAIDVIDLLKQAVGKIFNDARIDRNLASQIIKRFNKKKPIAVMYEEISLPSVIATIPPVSGSQI